MKDRIAKARAFYEKYKSPLLVGTGIAIGGGVVYAMTNSSPHMPDIHLRATEEQLRLILENPTMELVFPVHSDFEITMAVPA